MHYLPSKKFIIVILSIVVIIVGVYGFQIWQKNIRAEKQKQELAKIEEYAKSNINTDTDNDGLMDWEESKFGTDPRNPDTDKDGTLDGIEVAEGRNPLVPGPNDYINYVSVKTATTTPVISSETNLTETEKMMRTLLTVAQKDDQNDPNFPDTVAKNIVNDLSQKVQAVPKNYTVKNISTVMETVSSLKQYGNELGGIFKKYDSQGLEQNKLLYAITLSLKTGDNTSFKDVPSLEKGRQNEIAAILKIKVPEEIASFHIDILNEMSGMILSMENITTTLGDPTRGLIGMQQYKNESTSFNTSLDAIKNHLSNSGVEFTPGENGYFLFGGTATNTNTNQ